MNNNLDIKIEADLSKPIDDINSEIVMPPVKTISSSVTKLLSVVDTFIDNVTYKYLANSEYKKKQFLRNLEEKYKEIPEKCVVEPDISILGNTLDILKYNLDKDYLVDLYSNIMISDMDNRTKSDVHISFVEILKQLDKNDLKILEAIYKMKDVKSIAFGKLQFVDSKGKFAGYELHNSIYMLNIKNYLIDDYNLFSNSIENLQRLGLIDISYEKHFTDKTIYDNLLEKVKPSCNHILSEIDNADVQFGCERGILSISNLGFNLMKICLRDYEIQTGKNN